MSVFPKYDRYKDSGVDWLGDVPEHWEVESLRAAAELFVEKNRPDLPVLSVYRKYGVILKDSRDDNHNATSLDRSSYKVVQPGDLAVNKMKAWQGSLGVSEHHGIVSPAYITCRLNQKKVSGRYIHYLLRSKSLVGALDSISYGVRVGQWDMRFEDFKKVGITIPPKPEQDRIVTFLDRKTAEIDALIAKKQRQIELLDEQKAILINRAVTRGLNPNAKLKPSGIEWIGEIPEGWVTAPLYSRCDVRLGKMLDEKRFTGRFAQPYLRNTDVQWFNINSEALPEMDFRPDEYERYGVRKGDVLVCEGGEPGRAAIWNSDEPCFFQKALHRVRPLKGDLPKFLLFQFRNAVTQSAFSGVDKATIAHLTGEQLRRFRFAFPPFAEQQSIADHLLDLEAGSKKSKDSVARQIQSLKTLRSTLIAHAVTGKIKV